MRNLRESGDSAPSIYPGFIIEAARDICPFVAHLGIMMIEIWERMRGYHQWTEAQAVIDSANINKEPIQGSSTLFITTSADTLAWTDQAGRQHSAKFTVPDDSPLFKRAAGETVTIRFNPADPDRFYLRDLLRTQVHAIFVKVLVWTCVALIVIVYILHAMARSYLRHHTKTLW